MIRLVSMLKGMCKLKLIKFMPSDKNKVLFKAYYSFVISKTQLAGWDLVANTCRAGGNCLAAPVLARPIFLKVKMNFHFYK